MENVGLWHERDLSNSANERFTIPMGCILLDEMLDVITKVVLGLQINKEKINSNINITKGQIYAEFVLDALIKKGIPRLEAYRQIQQAAFKALENGEHFLEAINNDPNLNKILSESELKLIFSAKDHLSASSKIIDKVAKMIKDTNTKFSIH
jgi:adenylosuccinate lyase